MKIIPKIKICLIFTLLLIIASCAQQGAPIGGPEDVTPPVVVKANPANYSTNMHQEKIMITFDEFLDMGNFAQELIVSPPMEEKPEVKLKNKTLIIEFEEELKEDVTYTFNFGEGIKDLNEKNVLLNYEYVFATGEKLDSLSVKGKLKNAFDLSIPETPINIMLYSELNDSLPLTDIPYYVGRTDKEGNFAVNNLRGGIYKLFVLKDGNNNFLFDLPNEQIAFLDSSLYVDGDYFRKILIESGLYDSSDLIPDTTANAPDTRSLAQDSLNMTSDSTLLSNDSLEITKPDFNSIYVDLFMFTEDPLNQFISDYSRKDRSSLKMVFNLPLSDSFSYAPIYPPELQYDDLIPEFGIKRDSLTLWLSDTITATIDTISLRLQYTILDTLGNPLISVDTLKFNYRESSSSKKSAKEKEKTDKTLKIKTIRNKGKQHILKDLNFTLTTPVKDIDPTKFNMFIIPDTIEIPEPLAPFIDSFNIRRVKIRKKWKEEGSYRIVLYPGAINDIYGASNDTMDINFKIRPLAEYGRINLSLENVEDPILIQIFKSDKIITQREAKESDTFVFDFVEPDTYRIKFIHDRNNNGKWDSGKYLEGIQPEHVEFLPKDLKVRANWDHDITYTIGSNDSAPVSESDKNEGEEEPLF